LSWIVQIRQLKQRRRNAIEKLLSVFDQGNAIGNKHLLEIDETQYPAKFRPVVEILLKASASKQVRENMQLEDDYIKELLMRDERYAAAEAKLQIAETKIAEKDQALADKDQALADQAKTLADQAAELQKYKALLNQSGINLITTDNNS
jgi:hypothetical protein